MHTNHSMSPERPPENEAKGPQSKVDKLCERIKNQVQSTVRVLRVAPLGNGFLVFNTALLAIELAQGDYGMAIGSVVGDLICLKLSSDQYLLKRRLATILDDRGYSDALLKPTTEEWCSRQSTRVLLEERDAANGTSHLADYTRLCEESAPSSSLSWLPHI